MDIERIAPAPERVDEEFVETEIERWIAQPMGDTYGGWRIASLGAADWALRKLAAARKVQAEYDDEIYLWQRAQAKAKAAADWFEARLQEWAREQRTEATKSFTLAHGTVSTRVTKASIVVVSVDAALEWAREHCPDAVEEVPPVPASERFMLGSAGNHVKIGEVTEAFDLINADGETVATVPSVGGAKGAVLAAEVYETETGVPVVARPIIRPAVVDKAGNEVPGLGVKPARVSAMVRPLGL